MSESEKNDDDLIGQIIAGRYRIISRLGTGGMGVAYRAWDQEAGVPVVLKMPHRRALEDPTFCERFGREAQFLERLKHPQIVPIRAIGEHEGRPYVVMRFLPGGSLSNRRLRDDDGTVRPNPPGMLHLWLPAIAEALDFVHAHGVVHRDVKPANIFFDAFWGAFLGDFGIAKTVEEHAFEREHTLTATNMGLGTQEYMAPEQFTPKARIQGHTDQYALAITVYELLAGRRPFRGETSHLIVEILTQPVPSLALCQEQLPASLVAAVDRGLAKNPQDRFGTCREFAAEVLRDVPLLADEPEVARLLCPSCSNILKLPVSAAGRKGKCPKCQTEMKVAGDLGALWLLDEARKQRRGAKGDSGAATSQADPDSRPSDDRMATAEELQTFESVSGPTPVWSAAWKSVVWPSLQRLLRRRATKPPQWRSLGRMVGAVMAAYGLAMLALGLIPGPDGPTEPHQYITLVFEEPPGDLNHKEIENPDLQEMLVDSPPDVPDPDAVIVPMPGAPEVDVGVDLSTGPAQEDSVSVISELTASDMMDTIGAVGGSGGGEGGGKGGGFGARGKPGKVAGMRGCGADTEAAVDRALKWLAEHQMPDGGWDFDLGNCPSCEGQCSHSGRLNERAGATALALLPFLGRGYTHREGPYKKQVDGGIRWLVNKAVSGNGNVTGPNGSFYSVGVAGIALSECYAMSQDPDLAAPTQTVLNFIMASQDPNRGGWRYYPKGGSDTSATGWQLMALKSGHMAYLQVRPEVIKKAGEFLDGIQLNEQGSAYGYDSIENAANATPATSAVGLLCRMYLGWQKDRPGLQAGGLVIAQRGPTNDLYYDYYATQVMFHLEGEMWIAWNAKMKALLLQTQAREGHEAGSWYNGVSGGVAAPTGGRIFCTAMATMILEVYYRYLPIYDR